MKHPKSLVVQPFCFGWKNSSGGSWWAHQAERHGDFFQKKSIWGSLLDLLPWKLTASPWKMVVGRLKRLSFWNGPFLGDMLVFAGVGFFHGGGCRARWAAFFCHLRHPEKRKHSGETNVWDILVKILRLPKWIRNSSESKLLVEEGSKGWSFVQLISDLGDLRHGTISSLTSSSYCCWKNQKSGINSPVEVEPLVVNPVIYRVLAPSQVVVWLGFLNHQEYRTGDTHQLSSLLSLFLYFEVISKWCSDVFAHFELYVIYRIYI